MGSHDARDACVCGAGFRVSQPLPTSWLAQTLSFVQDNLEMASSARFAIVCVGRLTKRGWVWQASSQLLLGAISSTVRIYL